MATRGRVESHPLDADGVWGLHRLGGRNASLRVRIPPRRLPFSVPLDYWDGHRLYRNLDHQPRERARQFGKRTP